MISIRQARRMKDVSQKEMADVLGIHVQTYRKIESHPENATIDQAIRISQRLGVPYDELDFFTHNSTLGRAETQTA